MGRSKSTISILAENIKRLRQVAGLSRAQLSKKAKLTEAYISLAERHERLPANKKFNPTIEVLERIAKVLKCTVADLVTDPSETSKGRAVATVIEILREYQDEHG